MPREVIVRTAASGVCHSDLHYLDGISNTTPPAILGHEAAGVVEAVGDQVTYLKPGDHVIGCLSVFCGCHQCLTEQVLPATSTRGADPPRLSFAASGDIVNQVFNLSSFAGCWSTRTPSSG